MANAKRRLLILVGFLISALFLWVALKDTNFAEIGDSLSRANFWMIVPLLAAYAMYYWIKAIRWRLLLLPMKETTTKEVFSPMMIGFMGNNILPAHLGEFVRMYLGAKQLRLRKTQVLATIVLERMFDFLSVVFFLVVVLIFGRKVPEELKTIGYVTAVGGIALLAGAACYVTWTTRFLGLVRDLTFFFPAGLRDGLLHQLEVGAEGLVALKRPKLLAGIIATSVIQWAFMGIANFLAIIAIGIVPPLSSAFVVLAAATFAVTLPAAPGFLGSVQAAFKLALIPYGIGAADAVAASAVFHVPTYLSVTLLGLWLVRRRGVGLAQLQAEAESATEAEFASHTDHHTAPGSDHGGE